MRVALGLLLLAFGGRYAAAGEGAPSGAAADHPGQVRMNGRWVERALVKHVRLKTSLGRIRLALLPGQAPAYCRWFIRLCQAGLYDGTIIYRIRRGLEIEAGVAEARTQKLRPEQQRLLRPVLDARPPRPPRQGQAAFLAPEKGEPQFMIFTNKHNAVYPPIRPFARVHAGFDTLDRIEDVQVNAQLYPLHPVLILEATVIEPSETAPRDPAYEQLCEERHARFRDPKYSHPSARERYRRPPPPSPPVAYDLVFVLAALLALLGFSVFFFAQRLAPQQVAALGGLGLLVGGFALYTKYLSRAREEPRIALALFFGALAVFGLLTQVDREPQAGEEEEKKEDEERP